MSSTNTRYGSGSLRTRLEETFGGLVFLATALYYVAGTIAMFIRSTPFVS